MRIDKLGLNNYRIFEHLKVDFKPGVNLIYGINGSGKTTLLNAIRIASSGFFQGLENKVYQEYVLGFDDSDISIVDALNEYGVIEKYREAFDVSYYASFVLGNKEILWSRTKPKGLEKKNTVKELKEISGYGNDILNKLKLKNGSVSPIIAYYGTKRTFVSSYKSSKQTIDKLEGRNQGYLGCLFEEAIFNQLLDWWLPELFNQEVAIRNGLDVNFTESKMINLALTDVFQKLGEVSEDEKVLVIPFLEGLNRQIKLSFGKGKKIIPIIEYSDGFRNIIYLVLDIFWRLSTLNPYLKYIELKEKAYGVVMIDEIDLHLHPRWQEQVVPILKDLLPNVQFFITTHSPIVLGSLQLREGKDQVLIVSDGDVSIAKSLYGLDANTILSERMNAPYMAKDIENRVSELISKVEQSENLAEVKAEIEALKSLLGLPTSFTNNLDFAVAVREIELEEKDSE